MDIKTNTILHYKMGGRIYEELYYLFVLKLISPDIQPFSRVEDRWRILAKVVLS